VTSVLLPVEYVPEELVDSLAVPELDGDMLSVIVILEVVAVS
jgi:hypothetical protein